MNIDQQMREFIAAQVREMLPEIIAEVRREPYDDDDLLDTRAAARVIGMSRQWLECGRDKPNRPKYERRGRAVKYRYRTLKEWSRKQEASL